MGRNASGVKGIKLIGNDRVVGMVVADPEAQLLTACANGYGKRTLFGPNLEEELSGEELNDEGPEVETEEIENGNSYSSQRCYRAQRRGGKGLRDIKTTARNGPVIGIVRVSDEDELMMITARGKIQRVPAADVSVVGRNTQGVRIMNLDPGDTLVAVKRVPHENNNHGERESSPTE
jgi:DNA gyrase subunit A